MNMETVIIQIKSPKNAQILRSMAKILGEKVIKSETKNPYNAEFTKKLDASIKEAKEGKVTAIKTKDLWK